MVIRGSGALNTTALTLGNTATQNPSIFPGFGGLVSGPANSSATSYTGLTSPGGLGNGGPTDATSGTGSFVGIAGTLYVPAGYVSGSASTDTSTYANSTISSLGFTPGTYTYTWATGAAADSLVVNVPTGMPEPSTWAFVAARAGLLGFATLRRRAAIL